MKTILFTHTDLDGIGCEILMRLAFKDIEVYNLDYTNIDKRITSIDVRDSNVYITDICPRIETLKYIKERANQLYILDHHSKSKEFLKEVEELEPTLYHIDEKFDGVDRCGTYLVYEYLGYKIDFTDEVYDFVVHVDSWDTWKWVDDCIETENCIPLLLNQCLKYDKDFVDNMIDFFDCWFSDFDELLHNTRIKFIEELEQYKEFIKCHLKFGKCDIGTFGYLDSLQNKFSTSLISKMILDKYDIDYVISENGKSTSFRSKRKNDCHLIASNFDGGGHPQASGAPRVISFDEIVSHDYYIH